jgi:hypothetical protein
MEAYFLENPPTEDNLILQSELKKEQIEDVLEFFPEVEEKLDKEYIPDFLLHSPEPGNFQHQMVIIEVKSNPKLSFSGFKEDLLKIQEFITKYRYRQGIFLTVNTSSERARAYLSDSANITWVHENLPSKSNILFMCKERWDIPLFERNLAELYP